MHLSRSIYWLVRAAAKAAAARLRALGLAADYPGWQRRAEICEKCPVRVVADGVSYCGPPFLQQIDRDPATQGCGCPTLHKARTPDEHCPIDASHQPAHRHDGQCNCKWCVMTEAPAPGSSK